MDAIENFKLKAPKYLNFFLEAAIPFSPMLDILVPFFNICFCPFGMHDYLVNLLFSICLFHLSSKNVELVFPLVMNDHLVNLFVSICLSFSLPGENVEAKKYIEREFN